MRIDSRSWPTHRPWAFFTLIAAISASIWYFIARAQSGDWPSGSSLSGLTFGVLGGLICLFEMLFWGRKKVRTWRIGRSPIWLRAHIWLGLLSVPLIIYHSGFRLGGSLSTALMALFLLVIASGIWGLFMQQNLPQRMLRDVPAETLYSQIGPLAAQVADEAGRQLEEACGPDPAGPPAPSKKAEAGHTTGFGHLLVGASRAVDRPTIKPRHKQPERTNVPGADLIWHFYRTEVAPYLRAENRGPSPLRYPTRAAALFQELRSRAPSAIHEVVNSLENCCAQRRQLDEQARLHFWLHSWLFVHLPLSVAMTALLLVHVWAALKYW